MKRFGGMKAAALGMACAAAAVKLVEQLLAWGVDASFARPNGMTALLSVCQPAFTPGRLGIAQSLLDAGADATCTSEGHTLTFLLKENCTGAVAPADKELAHLLLDKGAGAEYNAKVRLSGTRVTSRSL